MHLIKSPKDVDVNGKPVTTTVTELPKKPVHPLKSLARLYHASAIAFSETTGMSLREVIKDHQGVVTALFIEARRCGLTVGDNAKLVQVTETITEGE